MARVAGKTKRKLTSTAPVDRSGAYLNLGRTNQKQRTRDALVAAAADAIRAGGVVSVADIADAAKVSRTTAYRYFPTSEMLAAQATLAAFPQAEPREIEAAAAGPGTPAERLDHVITGTDAMVAGHEASFRSLVRFTVERGPTDDAARPRRPTYRRQWLSSALQDLEGDLGRKRLDKLTAALSMLCGVESFIVLNDICQLPPAEALEIKRWAGQKLLAAALDDAAAPKKRSARAGRAGARADDAGAQARSAASRE